MQKNKNILNSLIKISFLLCFVFCFQNLYSEIEYSQSKTVTTINSEPLNLDSLFFMSMKTNDIKLMKKCIDKFTGEKRKTALMIYHQLFTNDGEQQSLDIFYKTYGREIPNEVKARDYELVKEGNNLQLDKPYNESEFEIYDKYIRSAAPKEKAFVALQKILSSDIEEKKWTSAIKTLKTYAGYFAENDIRISNLMDIFIAKWDKTIKINSVGNDINTPEGGEFSPVVTANDGQMYFCGIGRKDNIGGEDIFTSKKVNGKWGKAEIVEDLSSKSSNDAPISISTDGTKMLFFKSGKLYYSQKTTDGWAKALEFPNTINADGWQLDGMLTSDGKGIIFSSTRKGGYNLFTNVQKYHGDLLYPSDIYISLMTEDKKWGDPINLGPTINTPYCERMPFLHADMKTLYFSSDGHGGLGKLDVFKSTRLSDTCWTCWSEPANMGKEINTIESDAGYKVTTSGDKAYFSGERKSLYESSILLLLDVSGSMSGSKLRNLKEVTASVCENAIRYNSEISILTFSGKCTSPITDSCTFTKDYNTLINFVDNIQVGGETPTYEAYSYACEFMKRCSNPESSSKVIILLTDGDASGCTSLDSTLNKINKNKLLFKTQTILYDLSESSLAYSDLQKISKLTKGKFFSVKKYNELGSAFEAANNEIFNTSLYGNKDIYQVNLPRHLRPDFVSTISGIVLDKNKKPVSTEVRWDDLETGRNIGISNTDPVDGSYFIVLPNGKLYGYYVNPDSCLPVSNFVDLRNAKRPLSARQDIAVYTLKHLVENGLALKINNVFFNFGESTLLPASYPELKRLSAIIQAKKLKIELSGHTDNIGAYEYNEILSEKRAESVKAFLVESGCSADSLTTIGFGEKKAFCTNKTRNGRAKNRRVEIRILK